MLLCRSAVLITVRGNGKQNTAPPPHPSHTHTFWELPENLFHFIYFSQKEQNVGGRQKEFAFFVVYFFWFICCDCNRVFPPGHEDISSNRIWVDGDLEHVFFFCVSTMTDFESFFGSYFLITFFFVC